MLEKYLYNGEIYETRDELPRNLVEVKTYHEKDEAGEYILDYVVTEVIEETVDDAHESYIAYMNVKTKQYNNWKAKQLDKFKSLQADIITGLESELTAGEIQWYNYVKSFTVDYFTTEADYPAVPQRVREAL